MTTHRATLIVEQLERRATPSVKTWMTNYMKGSTPFIGCKIPVVRESVRCVVGPTSKKRGRGDDDNDDAKTTGVAKTYVEDAISLLRHDCGDAKQAGIILYANTNHCRRCRMRHCCGNSSRKFYARRSDT